MYEHFYQPIPNVDAYLKRIGVCKKSEQTQEYLDELIFAHQINVPFENADVIFSNKMSSLGTEELFEKIVVNNRGGICIELNGLFFRLLQELGFNVTTCFARVAFNKTEIMPVLHQGIIVKIDNKDYYADVGFGGPSPSKSICIEDKETDEGFVFEKIDQHWWRLKKRKQSLEVEDILHICTATMNPVDAMLINYYCATNPDSVFCQKLIVNLKTKNGSYSYRDGKLIICEFDQKQILDIEQSKLNEMLIKYFNLVI